MSISNMVANEKRESDKTGVPLIDVKDVVTWAKKIKMYLMKKKRNHLGLEPHGLVRPANHATAAVKETYQKALEAWQERKDTCVSEIYNAVEDNADALEIVDQYLLEKEILPANHADKETLASELLTRLINRFRGEIEDEVGDLSSKFTQFVMLPGEKVSTGIDRLNGIVQKLTQHGRAPTVEAKLAKLKEALEIPTLQDLWISIALMDNPTYAGVVATCKRYDKAMEKVAKNGGEIHFTESTKKVVCSYHKCGKPGHTQAQCYLKKKDQKVAELKRAGKSKAKQDSKPSSGSQQAHDGGKRGKQKKQYGGCFCCGSQDHRAAQCSDRVSNRDSGNTSNESRGSQNKRQKQDWNKYVRAEERDSDDEVNMMEEDNNSAEEVLMSAEDDVVFLDSCASKKLFIIRDQSSLETFVYQATSIQTTRVGVQLECLGSGSFKDWKAVNVCPQAVKNICSAGILREMGYGLTLLRVPRIVRLHDEQEVLTATYADNGMPYVSLFDLLHLPDLTLTDALPGDAGEVHLSDDMRTDPVELLHERCGHFSKIKLIEAHKHLLFTGSGLGRRHLSKKFHRFVKRHLCKSCAKAKITRQSFPASEPDALQATKFL